MKKLLLVVGFSSLLITPTHLMPNGSFLGRVMGATYLSVKYGLVGVVTGFGIATISMAGQSGNVNKEIVWGAIAGGVHGFAKPNQAGEQAMHDFAKLIALIARKK